MGNRLCVLIVEDSESDAALNLRALEKAGYDVESRRVEDAAGMKAALAESAWDMILADHNLPGFSSFRALAVLQESGLDIPFIVVSGTIGEETAVKVMKAGAQDYVLKNNLARLGPAVERELKESQVRRDRRKAVEALAENERRFRLLYEQAPIGYQSLDADGLLIEVNQAWLDMLGYARQEVIGRPFEDFLPPGSLDSFSGHFRSFREAGETRDQVYEMVRKDGTRIVVSFNGRIGRDEKGAFIQTHCTVIDITERMRAEEALRRSEEKFRDLVENVSEVIYSISPDGRITYVSPAAEAIIGYAAADLIGRPFTITLHPEDIPRIQASFQDVLEGRPYPSEYRMLTKGGETRHVRTSSRPAREGGKVVGVHGVLTDITERKLAEEEIRRSLDRLRKSVDSAVRAIAMTTELRDPYTAGHQQRVAALARAIGKALGFEEGRLEAIHVAGTLHDIGKIHIPAEILSKPGKLNPHEMNLIRTHPKVGHDILKTLELPWEVAPWVLQHHERLDGSGYPSGLAGEAVILEARIIAVADVVEAMASHRPYRPARGIDAALEEISQNKGKTYDPAVVEACLKVFREKGFEWPEAVVI